MTEQQQIVHWHDGSDLPSGSVAAELPRDHSAAIESLEDGTYLVFILNNRSGAVIHDLFSDARVARDWIEDKTRLLASGKRLTYH